uniref:DUF223 domain-containing protein n=1 Tax=Brassica oleracea var. oleracea TaxID=109376 RepID=A0A0D3BJG9_BRAOL
MYAAKLSGIGLKLRSSDHERKQAVVASGIESSIASWLRSCLGIELRQSEVVSWDHVTNGNKMRIRFRVRDREFSTGTVMQGFISSNCFLRYQPQLKSGSTYSLKNFFATKPKEIYRVSDLRVTICFSNSSVLFHLDHICTPKNAGRFRFHLHEGYEANCGLRGDLYGKL